MRLHRQQDFAFVWLAASGAFEKNIRPGWLGLRREAAGGQLRDCAASHQMRKKVAPEHGEIIWNIC
jgi:hypothetical protein